MDHPRHSGPSKTTIYQNTIWGPSWTICVIRYHQRNWGPPGPYTTTWPVRTIWTISEHLRSSPTTFKHQGSPSFQDHCEPPQTIPNSPVSGSTWDHLGLRVDQFKPSKPQWKNLWATFRPSRSTLDHRKASRTTTMVLTFPTLFWSPETVSKHLEPYWNILNNLGPS